MMMINVMIQLFRERLSEKMCTQQNPKGNMGYDQLQYTVPDTVAVEPRYFCCFPLALANIRP